MRSRFVSALNPAALLVALLVLAITASTGLLLLRLLPASSSPPPVEEVSVGSPGPLSEQGFGAFVPGVPGNLSALEEFEEKVGRETELVHWFVSWPSSSGVFTSGTPDSTAAALDRIASSGRVPLLTWEAWDPLLDVDQPKYRLSGIARGDHDGYVRSWARGLRQHGKVVYLRPLHEMNSNWYPWSGGVNGTTPEDFVAAWKHLRAVFASEGASNVRFVWAVNSEDVPGENDLESFWPGASQVDVMAIDGYNCYRPWMSFEELYEDPYERLAALDPRKPIWVTEVSSCEPSPEVEGSTGQSKAEWVSGMLSSERFPRISMLVWFDEAKSHNWRADSSPLVLEAFRSGFSS